MRPSDVDIEFAKRLDQQFEDKLIELYEKIGLEEINPKAQHQLKGILKHYAKEPHPFTACVRDNTKRFGKDRAERICATIKDTIWGTTKWRGKHNPAGVGPHPYTAMSEGAIVATTDGVDFDADGYIVISDEVADILTQLSESDLHTLLGLAQLEEDPKE